MLAGIASRKLPFRKQYGARGASRSAPWDAIIHLPAAAGNASLLWTCRSMARMSREAPTGRSAILKPANAKAADYAPVIREIQAAGVTSMAGIAEALNSRGIPTVLAIDLGTTCCSHAFRKMKIKITLAAVTVAALTCFAQAEQTAGVAPAEQAATLKSLPREASTVTNWYKQNVYDPLEQKIGVISDLLVGRSAPASSASAKNPSPCRSMPCIPLNGTASGDSR
jgi:hypothetical protein